jgi:hypothetical protein
MSALPPKADIRQRIEHVCFVPQAGIPTPREGISGFGRNAGGETPELFQLVARPLKETNSYKGAILYLQFARLMGCKERERLRQEQWHVVANRFKALHLANRS